MHFKFWRFLKYLLFVVGICSAASFLLLAISNFDDDMVILSHKNHYQEDEGKGDGSDDDDQVVKLNLEKAAKCYNIYRHHKLCLIVPFRDRFDELLEFVPHMKRFLCRQAIRNEIIIINQSDDLRFNRGSLINIGYLISKHQFSCDYIAMHDVDLLPINDQLNYSYPNSNPYHVSAPNLHPKYHYKNFVGGILLIKNEHFERVNGLSNRFWGWGREDDEFFKRLKVAKLKVERPTNIDTGNKTFRHIHSKLKRPRDYERFGDQVFISKQRDNTTGLNTVSYTEISRNQLTIDGHLALIINVHLSCNVYETPWCMHYKQLVDYTKELVTKMPSGEFREFMQVLKSHSITIQ